MFIKTILVFCAQALFIKTALSQCTSRAAVADGPGIPTSAYAAPFGLAAPEFVFDGFTYDGLAPWTGKGLACDSYNPAIDFSPTSGGGLPVSSASAVAPVGLAVASDNIYEGKLEAAGELPFVGTVGVEGVFLTAGAGAVNHHCGDGINAMVSDKTAFIPGYYSDYITPGVKIATPIFDYRSDWNQRSCVW